jgi:hypothetical protein
MTRKVKIVRASNAFIYLPLYMAEEYELFDRVQRSGNPFDSRRLDFTFSSVRTDKEGDRNAIDEMIKLVGTGEIAFALGDPMEIVESRIDPTELVVFGAIVKRPPFWIVNGHNAKTILDLKIQNLIYYERDTLQTGNYLGRFISDKLKLKESAQFAVVDEVGLELDELIGMKHKGIPDCGGLTVDLLGMARAVNKTGFKQCRPILSLHKQPEFRNFICTAFVTHKKVLKDETRAVEVLLQALSQAVQIVNLTPAVVAKHCQKLSTKKFFREQLRITRLDDPPKGLTAAESDWVARVILNDEIYSTDFSISEADWEKTARADRWTESKAAEVAGLYREVVEPGNALFRNQHAPDPVSVAGLLKPRPKAEPDRIASFLLKLERLDLREKTVIGDYRRFDDKIVKQLRDKAAQISEGLKNKTNVLENFLIWAEPGNGKTFFVEEIHRSLGKDVSFPVINFAETDEADARAKLAEIEANDGPTLTLYDEIDAKKDEAWPYDAAFPILTLNMRPDRPQRRAVFVLIGSTPPGLDEMIEEMRKRTKGKDLIDRVPERFAIPPLAMGDLVIVMATRANVEARKRNMTIESIDKMALYYVLKSKKYNTPRQIAQLFARAVQRMPATDTTVAYEDLFRRNDPEKMDFWTKNPVAVDLLRDTLLRLNGLNG